MFRSEKHLIRGTIDLSSPDFPREIAEGLNAIFESGVKIWYDENLYYDTYVN